MTCNCIGPLGNCPCMRRNWAWGPGVVYLPVVSPPNDPEYELVPATPLVTKRGRQCGQCGMKFDYGVAYGYCCTDNNCPMGWGRIT